MSNSVTLIGNITRDPEMRYVPSGTPQTTFGLAVNRRWQNRQNGQWEESTSFFDVVCWRDLALNVAESMGKGARVIVAGRLEQRSWEVEGGEKRSKIEVVADEVGPSLRWAVATISKVDRREQATNGRPAQAVGPGIPAGVTTQPLEDAPLSTDEEPF